jgi:membrane protease YdiL (CAAX protease family)
MSPPDDSRPVPEPPPNAADPSPESPETGPLEAAILSYRPSPHAATAGSSSAFPQGTLPETSPEEPPKRSVDPDLRVPWGWVDLLLLVIIWLGAMAISAILLAILFAAQGVPIKEIQQSSRDLGLFVVIDQVIVSAVVLLYLGMQTRLRFDAPFWRTLGWRKLDFGRWPRPAAYLGFVALGFVLAASVELVSLEFPAKTKLPIENVLQNRQAAIAILIMSVVLAPVVEETVFRGYIYPVVARTFGIAAGIIGTGTVFGLLHAEQLWGGWVQIALLVVVGIVFTWVRAAKRSVFASYLLHISYNLTIAIGGLSSLVHR